MYVADVAAETVPVPVRRVAFTTLRLASRDLGIATPSLYWFASVPSSWAALDRLLTDSAAAAGVTRPHDVRQTLADNADGTTWGYTIPAAADTVWLRRDLAERDAVDVVYAVAHEVMHLWQYAQSPRLAAAAASDAEVLRLLERGADLYAAYFISRFGERCLLAADDDTDAVTGGDMERGG